MFDKLGERIVIKMRVINLDIQDWNESPERFTESRKCNRFDFELSGMLAALKELDVDFEIQFTDSVEYVGITIAGRTYTV